VGHGQGQAVGADPADAVVVGVGDEKGARGVEVDPLRKVELGRRRRPPVAAVARVLEPSGQDGDDAGRVDAANSVAVTAEKVAGGVHRHIAGVDDLGHRRDRP